MGLDQYDKLTFKRIADALEALVKQREPKPYPGDVRRQAEPVKEAMPMFHPSDCDGIPFRTQHKGLHCERCGWISPIGSQ